MIKCLLDVFRPLRWYRNSFMLLGSILAVSILKSFDTQMLINIFTAFISLCLVASGNYGINEILDRKSDSYHPEKKHRAFPSGQIKVSTVLIFSILFYIIGILLVAQLKSLSLIIATSSLLLSGIVYNVPPIRLKDRPYLDFTSEALNNAIRIAVGWYAVSLDTRIVPSSFLLIAWFLGVFLMASKRFGEIRFIKDKESSIKYRKSFRHYTEKKLLISMIVSLSVFNYMFGALAFKYNVDLILMLPFLIIWIIWYFALAYEENTIVKDPERIFEKKGFLIFTMASFAFFIVLLFSKIKALNFLN